MFIPVLLRFYKMHLSPEGWRQQKQQKLTLPPKKGAFFYFLFLLRQT